MLLALDTATSAVTVAVRDDGRTLAQRSEIDVRRHTETLAPAVRDVLGDAGLRPADLTAIVVGVGPGPFTGLRVGVVTARTMGLALAIPVHGLCSLDAIAQQVVAQQVAAGAPERFLVATDARRKEVYWATYRAGERGAQRDGEPQVFRPGELPDDVRALPSAGRGHELYPDLLTGDPLGPLDVSAAALAELAETELAAGRPLLVPEPLYLRRPDAQPQPPRTPAGP